MKATLVRKSKDLFHPLRLALTGKEHGPELVKLFPLLGRDLCVRRIEKTLVRFWGRV